MRVCLVGLPGSGKTTVGRRVAKALSWRFVDSDELIEQKIGSSIAQFFAAQGEAAFRAIEEAVIAQLVEEPGGLVISTGGGAVLSAATRHRLRQGCHVIHLDARPIDLARRLHSDNRRPLLKGGDPLARLTALHAERQPLYGAVAHDTVAGHPGKTVHRLTNEVLACIAAARRHADEARPPA